MRKILNRLLVKKSNILILVLLLTFLIVGTAYLYYINQKKTTLHNARNDINTVAKLKIDQISRWYQDELKDAATISRDLFLVERIRKYMADGLETDKTKLLDHLSYIIKEHDYNNILITGTTGDLIISNDGNNSEPDKTQKAFLEKAVESGSILSTGLYKCEVHDDIHLSFVSPVVNEIQGPDFVMIFEWDPDKFLYPMIKSWPSESETSETFLVREENGDVLFLNELRYKNNSPMGFTLPMTRRKLPAARVLSGFEGVLEGRDYRGEEVVAYASQIPGTPWHMVAKLDKSEIFAPLYKERLIISGLVVLIIMFVSALLSFLHIKRQKDIYSKYWETQEEFRTTLYSIGDAVIATDIEGNVRNMNPVAEKLTGWSEAEARGRSLETVFRIINETTRSKVENPLNKVLKEGVVSGFANHTLLISRNKEEIPIAERGAPIKNEEGQIIGVVIVFMDQTIERETSRRLKESEQRLSTLISNLPGMVYHCRNNTNWTMDFVSDGCLELTGYNPEQLLHDRNISYADLIHNEDRQKVWDEVQKAIEENRHFRIRYRIKTAGGKTRWVFEQGRAIDPDEPGYVKLEGFITDITARIQAEQKNEERRRTLEEIFRVSPAIIYKLNPDYHNPGWVSENVTDILGYTVEETMQPDWWRNNLHEEDAEHTLAFSEKLNADNHLVHEYRFYKKNGEWVWIRDELLRVNNPENGSSVIVGAWVDITDRKKAEESLRINEKRYHELFEVNPHPMLVYEIDTLQIIEVNNSAIAHYGYTRDEFLSMSLEDLHPEDQIGALHENVDNVDEGLDKAGVWKHILKDGTIIYVEITSHTLLYGGRRAEVVLAYDITERIKAEERVRQSEQLLGSILDSLSEAVLLINPEDRTIEMCNQAACDIFGYSREYLQGKNTMLLHVDNEHYENFQVLSTKALNTGEEFIGEFQMKRADGNTFPTEHEIRSISDGSSWKGGVVSVIRDISDRKRSEKEKERLESQLHQAQKMESIGRLAGGVAHDFNNMIQAILGYVELSLSKVDKTGPLYEDLQEIRNAAIRSASLTRQLLAFARQQSIKPVILDLNDTVSGMLRMLQRIIGEDIELSWIPGRELHTIRMDPSQIDQILANLCTNARDSMEKGGKLVIETRNVTTDESYRSLYPYFEPGKYVMLSVNDNGCGMDKEILDNIFEPFYTTKDTGKGTGLGLATVYGIVKQNNSYIHVYSEPGRGTTVKVYFPVHSGEVKQEKYDDVQESVRGKGETILLVEDEEAILQMGRMVLEQLGYKVLASDSPEEAIELVEKNDDNIDLLITDLIMPGMNGQELAKRLRKIVPGMKCLYMSGYTSRVISGELDLEANEYFIQKPFSVSSLSSKVREVLGGG